MWGLVVAVGGGMTLCGSRLAGIGVGRVALSCLSCVVYNVLSCGGVWLMMGRPRRQVCSKPRKSLSGLTCVY